ncbi:ACT domain-containing protein [Demequina sp. NBRC 110053]|uniref:ACT domain-containing protein n=1 Tax=Demequina sp. NBRC 110053 TaxID=1570342 RepID=UPI000A03468E|nr:ACT domain-containing protein [Demequina sp. NBRC 110053]
MADQTELAALVRAMEPDLDPATYVWASVDGLAAAGALVDAVATVREAEGLTLVLPIDAAARHGLDAAFPSRRITLTVHSSLEAVGLTAAFSRALAEAGISANVVAGAHHDHIFVPAGRASDAMTALRALSGRHR